MQDLDSAPFGMVSLETTLAMVITYLIQPGKLTWPQAIAKLSTNPAKILGIQATPLGRIGGAALTIKMAQSELTWPLEELYDPWWHSIARAMR